MNENVPVRNSADEQRNGSYWSLSGKTPGRLGWDVFQAYRRNRLGGQCAQFAYYSLLALAPALILLIAAVSQLPDVGILQSSQTAVARGMPVEVAQLLNQQIHDIRSRSSVGMVGVSLLVLGFAGSRMFWTMGKGLDVAFKATTKRRAWIRGGIALGLTVGLFFVVIAGMLLLTFSPWLISLFTPLAEFERTQAFLFATARWGTVAGIMLLSASVIYWLATNATVPWSWLSPGSLFATFGWIAVTLGFRVYVENFSRYNETYGTLAGVVVLLTWLYLTGMMLLLGGQINAVILEAARDSHDS